MVAPTRPPRNGFNAAMRKIYNPLGFSKAYNFILWVIFAGALLGFVLARFMYLNMSVFCSNTPGNSASPGECYYYLNFDQYKIGIRLHLIGVLFSSLIAVEQFTPWVRHNYIIVHRIGGYMAMILWIISTVGAFMIARHAFGGGVEIQAWVGTVGIGSTVCFVLSYINIKRLQIEQHRAWMLRGWFYAGSIITSRFILIIASGIISQANKYYSAWPCDKIAFTDLPRARAMRAYPACAAYFNGTNPSQQALVHAKLGSSLVSENGAALNLTFGTALWVALIMHAVGVEVYLHLTPRESERLRNISYQRQLEAGMKRPGSAGLTADKMGDAEPWFHQPRKDSGQSDVTRVGVPLSDDLPKQSVQQ